MARDGHDTRLLINTFNASIHPIAASKETSLDLAQLQCCQLLAELSGNSGGKILPVRLLEDIQAEEKENYLSLRAFFTKKSCYVTWDVQHACLCGTEEPHPESPGRIQRILAQLEEAGLLAK
jgi:hypothetical protein